jgi:hypothetical protein
MGETFWDSGQLSRWVARRTWLTGRRPQPPRPEKGDGSTADSATRRTRELGRPKLARRRKFQCESRSTSPYECNDLRSRQSKHYRLEMVKTAGGGPAKTDRRSGLRDRICDRGGSVFALRATARHSPCKGGFATVDSAASRRERAQASCELDSAVYGLRKREY